jgi:four helix bundle protein
VKLSHHELDAWKVAVELVREVYALTAGFPGDERFGLVSQMRRAAVSVPSNIAEGAARGTSREFAHFLVVARGSLAELETQLRISGDLGFVDASRASATDALLERTFALLSGLLRSLDACPTSRVSRLTSREPVAPAYASDQPELDDDASPV